MAQESKITILSTFASDKLVSENGVTIIEQEGGPAFYLKKVFEKEGTLFVLRAGSKINVQILVTRDGEFGKVLKNPTPKNIRFSQIKTPFLLISSVLDEFDLAQLPLFNGKVFFDVQGYTRDGTDFGKKKLWTASKAVFENILCLKGTKEELRYIPRQYLDAQKQKILIVTKGKSGCEVFVLGKRWVIRPPKVISSKNAIGAGDTFFAYFISYFIKTSKVLDSVKYAVKKTVVFLAAKNIHHHNQLFLEEIDCG